MLTNVFVPKLQNISLNSLWFQHDGATCYTAKETVELLHESLPGCVIFRFGGRLWSSRSYDLTPLDFFLLDFLKSQVYVNKLTMIEALRNEMRHCITEI